MAKKEEKKDWTIFFSSVFFVLGFSLVFSLLGVLLQTVLLHVTASVQLWLSRIGGVLIILFGLYLLGIFKLSFLEKQKSLKVKKFKSGYVTSFVFGAAFAVGWTPCIGIILGGILSLAVSQPTMAFFLLLAYSLGLGIPFLIVGLFTNQAERMIFKLGKWFTYFKILFGILLIGIGGLVFVNQLGIISNFGFAVDLLYVFEMNTALTNGVNFGLAFLAGLISFLSPCVLPLIPPYLTYLASLIVKD